MRGGIRVRKRTMILTAGLAAAALSLAPGIASAGVFVPEGSAFGNITESTPPSTPFTSGVFAPWGGAFGNITEATAPNTVMPAGVMVPEGSAFGNITIATAPNVIHAAGVMVPKGSAFGNLTVEKPLSSSHVPDPPSPMLKGTTNSCYNGACPDNVLSGHGPAAGDSFGGGTHSTGPQQAIRDGILTSVSFTF